MNTTDLAEILKTPAFWVASAVGSVALSVIGNLVTPKVAQALSERSSDRRKKVEKKRARFLGEVIIRVTQPEKILYTKIDSMHAFLIACVFMLLALLLFTAATALEWLLFPVFVRMAIALAAIPIVWLSMYLTKEGLRRRRIALSAIEYLDEQAKQTQAHPNDRAAVLGHMDDWLFEKHGMRLDDIKAVLKPLDPTKVTPDKISQAEQGVTPNA